jgi:hypothetical protein
MTIRRLTHIRLPGASQLGGPATPATQPSPRAPAQASDRQPHELLTPAVAADRLSVNVKVLERWRGTGNGPAFVKLTSKTIRYRSEDLDVFIAGRVRANTAA